MKAAVISSLALCFALTACMPPKNESSKSADAAGQTPLTPAPEKSTSPRHLGIEAFSMLDTADQLPIDLKEQCAVDVCGTPSKNDPAQEAQAQAAANQLMQSWQPKIQKAVDLQSQMSTIMIKRATDLQETLTTQKLEPKYIALINLIWALSEYESVRSAWDDKLNKFDDVKYSKLGPLGVSRTELAQLKLMLQHYIASDDIRDAFNLKEEGLQLFFERKTGSKDSGVIQSAITAYAKSVRSHLETFRSQFPTLEMTIDPATIDLSEGRTVDQASLQRFTEDIRGASFLHAVTDDISTYTVRQPHIKNEIDTFFTISLPAVKLENSEIKLQQKVTHSLDVCREAAVNINRIRLNESQAAIGAGDLIETIRSQAAAVASTYVSSESARRSLLQKIADIQFSLPVSTAQSQKMIDQQMNKEIDSATKDLELKDKMTNQDLILEMAATNLMRSSKTNSDEDSTIGDCQKHDPSSVGDHSVTTLGTIRLSWPTLIDRQSAYGVVAHEFGHIVSAALAETKNQSYAEVYKCVDARQRGKNTKSTQEEDFADLFGSRVLANFEAANTKTGNFACLLLREKNDATRYGAASGLSMSWPANNEYEHSPNLYRLVQIEIDRKHSLSDACSQVQARFLPTMTNQCSF